jgi:hypothetical protein
MRAGFSFSYPPISLLLGQPLSIKKSYAGAIQMIMFFPEPMSTPKKDFSNFWLYFCILLEDFNVSGIELGCNVDTWP